jgi:hypothetical protein
VLRDGRADDGSAEVGRDSNPIARTNEQRRPGAWWRDDFTVRFAVINDLPGVVVDAPEGTVQTPRSRSRAAASQSRLLVRRLRLSFNLAQRHSLDNLHGRFKYRQIRRHKRIRFAGFSNLCLHVIEQFGWSRNS